MSVDVRGVDRFYLFICFDLYMDGGKEVGHGLVNVAGGELSLT